MQSCIPALGARALAVSINVFDERVIGILISDCESDCFKQFGHYSAIR